MERVCTKLYRYNALYFSHSEKKSVLVMYQFLQLFVRISLPHVLQKFIVIFANERFLVVASDVMPNYTIRVKIIQNSQTGFVILPR